MNNYELLSNARLKLQENNLDEKLANYLYEYLFNNDKDNITISNIEEYNNKLSRIINGEPLQYIIEKTNFYGYDLKVNNNVLIPRFETEELVYYTLEYINRYFNNKISIVDVGTGSGAIAVTLKKELCELDVYATDISKKAIEVAKENASKLNAEITFLNGDMLEPLRGKKFDILISNPPYLKENQNIEKIVVDNEPNIALFGGVDGLKYYRQVFKGAKNVLNKKSLICLEISEEIKEDIERLVIKYFNSSRYEFKKDMSNRTRMLFIFNNID